MTGWPRAYCTWRQCRNRGRYRVELQPWGIVTYRCGRHLVHCTILSSHDPA